MQYCYFESPLGKLLIAGSKTSLELIGFPTGKMAAKPQADWEYQPEYFANCIQQLSEYFAGKREVFELAYTLRGTAFQQQVLQHVAKIQYGTTQSYSAIAQQVNNPKAVRAVGLANGTNKLPIIIPCHRVIGKNGSLTGFGGGLGAKRFLLSLENAT
jgi:methylated-DNA-[protein]-cysteine S-methyltransferase